MLQTSTRIWRPIANPRSYQLSIRKIKDREGSHGYPYNVFLHSVETPRELRYEAKANIDFSPHPLQALSHLIQSDLDPSKILNLLCCYLTPGSLGYTRFKNDIRSKRPQTFSQHLSSATTAKAEALRIPKPRRKEEGSVP